jgi:hypothetical protein
MLTEVCAELRNYFVTEIHEGTFEIVGGKIAPLDFLQEGQYYRIVGSVFNDGVHQYTVGEGSPPTLADERFSGAVWAMAVPSSVIALTDDIKSFCDSDSGRASAYTSESFGGYSYSKATDANGAPMSWQKVFASRLKKWRRISVL